MVPDALATLAPARDDWSRLPRLVRPDPVPFPRLRGRVSLSTHHILRETHLTLHRTTPDLVLDALDPSATLSVLATQHLS
jgi:hypothetical protein